MENIKIDLHIHTNKSDGEFSPFEIIDIAKNNHLEVIAISDHDTVEAYSEELFNYSNNKNIKLIPAVEISTRFNNVGFHVLGYNIDIKNEELINTLSKLKNARVDYLLNVSKLLSNLGYVLNIDKLKNLPTVTKAHISQDIISNENNKPLLLKTFGHIPNKGEFIETIMNEGCPAFVEKYSITPMDASKIIKEASGKVILAHPVAYLFEDRLTPDKILELVKIMRADGIESNYIYVDKLNNVIDQTEFWNDFALKNNLIATIGSDFHNFDKTHPEIGFINLKFKIPKTEPNLILKKLLNN